MIRKISNGLIVWYRTFFKSLLNIYFKRKVKDTKFCIFSNDCWGAEIYKMLDRPYNTPFVGLMLMSPCYLKLLENPKYYLNLPLNFIDNSRYESMQKINVGSSFPLAVLGDTDIEIQFLHYESREIAKEKWDRRVKRIDWDHLFIKYDCGKDYADKQSVEKFLDLPFKNKLVFGKENFGIEEVYVSKYYSLDAVVQFKNCFLILNPITWLLNKETIKSRFHKLISKIVYNSL